VFGLMKLTGEGHANLQSCPHYLDSSQVGACSVSFETSAPYQSRDTTSEQPLRGTQGKRVRSSHLLVGSFHPFTWTALSGGRDLSQTSHGPGISLGDGIGR
jgi:hypothetical protein